MDVLGVNPMKTQRQFKRNRKNKGVKVVYISSPMKVKTSASEFRALVQELTGINSDAERFMEIINGVGNCTADVHPMKTGVEGNFNRDFATGSSEMEHSPFLHLQAFGNNQSIFS